MASASTTLEVPGREAPPEPPPAVEDLGPHTLRLVVAGAAAAVGIFLASRLPFWPPHEDETLELFIGQGSLPSVLETVLGDRGGAPLHFVLAWAVVQLGGSVAELRVLSALFAVASLPLIALVAVRLADRATAAAATVLAAASWTLLFHGVYARMYSLFLFTATLSYLALLAALERGGVRRWALWVGAILLTVATHPYGALVLGSQVLFVLARRERVREAAAATAVVGVLGLPFWLTNLVLADRFGVGVGGGGERLGNPVAVVEYLGRVAADFSAGYTVLPVVLALLALGVASLVRERPRAAALVGCAFGTPVLAFLAARLGTSAAPETRHLIFTLPFFALTLAAGVVAVGRSGRPGAQRVASATVALLAVGAVTWAWGRSPTLFAGEPAVYRDARAAAAAWLVETGRPDDVLLGYEPAWLRAWERSEEFSRTVLPRADARLALQQLERAGTPLGRGVWVLDGADTTNLVRRSELPFRLPRPAGAYEARTFGPYLIVRTREPTGTVDRYLERSAAVALLGKWLVIGDSDRNFQTMAEAAWLRYGPSSNRSSSASSR